MKYEYRRYGKAGANSETFEQRQSKLDISAPVTTNGHSRWRAHAGADLDQTKTKARFSNGTLVPERLWDIGGGFSLTRALEGDRTAGGNFTISSAGDRPFGRGRDLGFSLNLSYKIPEENEASWFLFLSMSNTRGFLNYVPLPGVAYSFKAGERTRMVLGLPFVMIFWRPVDPLSVSFFYFPIRTSELRVSYGSPRGPQPYALASFRTRNFRIYDRTEKDERLFAEEGILQAGLSSPVSRSIILDLSGGVAFGRRMFLAKKATEHKTAPGLRMENAPFVQLKASATF